jgi:hypothetical protein
VSDVPAHSQKITHSYTLFYPPHPARQEDPHYRDFEAYRRRTKDTAQCVVGVHRVDFSECHGELELHHAHVEFSLQNGVDLAWLEKDYPGISDPDKVGAWVESADNLQWLCVAEGAPVLMADGSTSPIEYVHAGSHIIGGDGRRDLVTGSKRKWYSGEVIAFGSALFTPTHRVLGRGGWVPSAEVLNQFRVHGPQMIPLRCEKQQIRADVVSPVFVDVMDALSGEQSSTYPSFHDQYVFHDKSVSIPDPDVSLGGHFGSSVTDVPLGQLVERVKSAHVGAVTPDVESRTPVRGAVETLTADFAGPEMGWVALTPRSLGYTGWVHDLTVAHSHSFIAGGVVAHNCEWHHRGQGGVHVATESDFEASRFVRSLIRENVKPD